MLATTTVFHCCQTEPDLLALISTDQSEINILGAKLTTSVFAIAFCD